ncbi:3-oxoacyl-[acyl-carrier protein] reductase [Quadrisphaera granulorum]|uniref:3-oxoacyl-[acyl-carrier protein] reductase n=1 Tax=Quadrisphaera granulorum TaxID=317664 RepID=A0A316A8X9_9ACTN|nr:SDR family oxidoreductase [Quadrisphaera granulorum]PWJ54376.1 3-oxoacyl-[acyl-carrier protein] reductase [Quadrisphaera granulorum]SZE96148.1 3-oxoacyl-[acyl-carrier protein] reductase [Quadrisphaera granulorum]
MSRVDDDPGTTSPSAEGPRSSVVTGGGRGLGRAIAERLQRDGHRVAVLDVEVGAPLPGALLLPCDVTEPDAVMAAVAAVVDAHGGLDVLVNGAGLISPRTSYRESTKEELVRYLTTNAVSCALTVQAAHDHLVASGRGAVVNIASRTFFTGSPGQLGYVASKGAVLGITRVLARELGPQGVTVNAAVPGQVATPGTREHLSDADFNRTMAQQAIPRRGQPHDLAGLVSFLAGDDARMITGQTVVCDGGGLMH